MNRAKRITLGTALILAATLLGCDGVGDGNAIEYIEIVPVSAVIDESDDTVHLDECLPQSLAVVGHFSDGSSGDYTWRATLSSNNPSVARVSNGDIEPEGIEGEVYLPGTVLPSAPGTATIMADFVGLTASLRVTVDPLGEISFIDPNPTVGVDTAYFINLQANLQDNPVNMRTAAFWSFLEPDDEVATIVATGENAGRVVGVGEGGPLVAQASFPLCGRSYTTEVHVEAVDSLTLEREHAGSDGVPASATLDVGTTEGFMAYANFASGAARQDITSQAYYESSDPAVALILPPNYARAMAPGGPVQITAYFGQDDAETEEVDERVPSNSLPLTVIQATLDSFVIDPVEVTVPRGCTFRFSATGSFDGGAHVQSITRSVLWASADPGIATVSNSFLTAGTYGAVGEVGETVEITATYVEDMATEGGEDDVESEVTGTLTIGEPGPCPGNEPPVEDVTGV